MIRNLHIENYVLIDRLDISPEKGLNIITGETGAGKSILLGAVALLLGERADGSVMGRDDRNCLLEAEFDITDRKAEIDRLLDENGIERSANDDTLVIRRVISPNGRSRSFVDDYPATLSLLKALGGLLVDIHSQHQTLLLGDSGFQMEVVDAVAGTHEPLKEYTNLFERVNTLKRSYAELQERAAESRKEEDYLRFQYEQLQSAKLVKGESEALENEHQTLSNAAQIGEALFAGTDALSDGETSAVARIKQAKTAVGRIAGYLRNGEQLNDRLESLLIETKDIFGELEMLREQVQENPARLAEVEARLDLLLTLQQKHGLQNEEELIALRDEIGAKLQTIENSDEELTALKKEVEEAVADARKAADGISRKRKTAIPGIEKIVRECLTDLGIPNGQFRIELTTGGELRRNGTDEVAFLFSANKGNAPERIEKVASGGEMSRLMLALKKVVAGHKAMPTLIFDEIDSGVSGSVADRMGEIMQEMGRTMQVLNITHLPQVASKGDHHFFVYKEHGEAHTNTRIVKLSEEERIRQIAVMLSGSSVTEAAVSQAKELLKSGR